MIKPLAARATKAMVGASKIELSTSEFAGLAQLCAQGPVE
jgi:hypothetical protein